MLLFPFFRFGSSCPELGGDRNESLILVFLIPPIKDSLQTWGGGGASRRQKLVRDFETCYANIHIFLHINEMHCLFFQVGHFLLLSGSKSTVLLKKSNPHLPLKKGLARKARPCTLTLISSAATFPPHLQCVEDIMVGCYFPLALLLEITACDCDKWIFPLNSLVEWGIPLTIGTIPTQVKHWLIFFL